MVDELSAEERAIADVIRAARKIQEFLWGQHNAVWELEEWRRMFRKRVAKLDEVDPSNPHASIEIKKRLLQTAALAVAMIGRIDNEGMPSLTPSGVPSNLPQYAVDEAEIQQLRAEVERLDEQEATAISKCTDLANRYIREANRREALEQERDSLRVKVKQLTDQVQYLQQLFDADSLYKRMHSAEQERDELSARVDELREKVEKLSDLTKVSKESLAEEPLSPEDVGKAELHVLSRTDCRGMSYIEASLMRRLVKTIADLQTRYAASMALRQAFINDGVREGTKELQRELADARHLLAQALEYISTRSSVSGPSERHAASCSLRDHLIAEIKRTVPGLQ